MYNILRNKYNHKIILFIHRESGNLPNTPLEYEERDEGNPFCRYR